jgi:hypothetical protein
VSDTIENSPLGEGGGSDATNAIGPPAPSVRGAEAWLPEEQERAVAEMNNASPSESDRILLASAAACRGSNRRADLLEIAWTYAVEESSSSISNMTMSRAPMPFSTTITG